MFFVVVCFVFFCAEANETKDIPGSSFKDGPSANSTTSKPAEPPHNRILSHAHEVEVASSLDRELYNLFHC